MPDRDFRSLTERLLRAGIAPKHVRRMVAELQTHYALLVDEELARGQGPEVARESARTRLGADDDIIDKTREQPSLRSWGARWPLALCGVAPVLGLIGSAALLMASLVALSALAAPASDPGPWFRTATRLVGWGMLYALPLAWAYLLARYCVTRRLPWRWPVGGLFLTALAGAMTNFGVTWPNAAGRGQLSAGIGWTGHGTINLSMRWLVTFLLGLALYLVMRQRLARRRTG